MRTEPQQKQANNMPDSHSVASTSGEEDNGSDSSQVNTCINLFDD
ncbi:unnamed protein product [Strongylus vulgaris]|uniref:Uncharacterized protein n=1 Tax=Strongylus vulgaris TaxID=40348 RepID=A0A3P7IHC9_STRVU|nr:unnamed protein product [Strongylus vulgaris]